MTTANQQTQVVSKAVDQQINQFVFEMFHKFYSLHKLDILSFSNLVNDLERSLGILFFSIRNHDNYFNAYSGKVNQLNESSGFYPDLFKDAVKTIPQIMAPMRELEFAYMEYKNNETVDYTRNHILRKTLMTCEEVTEERLNVLGFHVLSATPQGDYIQKISNLMIDLTNKLDNLEDKELNGKLATHYAGNKIDTLEVHGSAPDYWEYIERAIEATKGIIQPVIKPMFSPAIESYQVNISESIDGI